MTRKKAPRNQSRQNLWGKKMRKKLNRPWLTATEVERPLSELKEISNTWDKQIWGEYLDWFQSGNSEKLVSKNVFNKISEELQKNIFEEFGYQACPKLQSFCDQLLSTLPSHQQYILRAIFFDGKTERKIAGDMCRSAGYVSQNKTKAITTLKREHCGEMLSTRQYMRGADVFIPDEIKSEWDQKLSHPICEQRTYSQSEANNELLNHKCAELREIFQELTDRSRQIIYLKFWCNLSVSEIARKCSVGLNTVEQILDATVFKIKSRLIQNINEDKQIA